MLSQINQKKIRLKLKSIYRSHLSEIEISDCCEEITRIINKFNKKKGRFCLQKVTCMTGPNIQSNIAESSIDIRFSRFFNGSCLVGRIKFDSVRPKA